MTERTTQRPGLFGEQGSATEIGALIPPDPRKKRKAPLTMEEAMHQPPLPLTRTQRIGNWYRARKTATTARMTVIGNALITFAKGGPGAWRRRISYAALFVLLAGLFALFMGRITYPSMEASKQHLGNIGGNKAVQQAVTVTAPEAGESGMEFILDAPSHINLRGLKQLKSDGTRKCRAGQRGWKFLGQHDIVICGDVLESDNDHHNNKKGG